MTSATPRFDLAPPTPERMRALVAELPAEARHLLIDHAEEAPFSSGTLLLEARDGRYACRLCGLPLFTAATKFDSGTGWPCFNAPIAEDHLRVGHDRRYGLNRTEVTCARCRSHHGHLFADGPPPTGLRYCLNAGGLDFIPADEPLPDRLGRGSPEGKSWPG